MLVAAVGLYSLSVSRLEGLGFSDAMEILVSHLTSSPAGNEDYDLAVWEFNVPRTVIAVTAGAVLATGGAVMQTVLRNPLASPYTTGISAGASMGAALYIYLGVAVVGASGYYTSIAANAMVFAMIPTATILAVSRLKHITPTTMILAGVAIMYVFSAATNMLMLLADPDNVQEAYEWGIGTLARSSWDNVWPVIAGIAPCMMLLMLMTRSMNMLNAGSRNAMTMGVNARVVRDAALLLVAVMCSLAVAVTGGIGFIGLIAPHLARILVGSDMKCLLPCSAILGTLVLLAADIVTRSIMSMSIPVGVLIAVIGGPIFIAILVKGSKKVWFRASRYKRRSGNEQQN